MTASPFPAPDWSVMAFAEQFDVEARLGRNLTADEEATVDAKLDDATALVAGYCGKDFELAPYPDAVVGVTAGLVARALTSAASASSFAGLEQVSTGPFAAKVSSAASSGDMYLSASDRLRLRFLRTSTTSVLTYGERYTDEDVTS